MGYPLQLRLLAFETWVDCLRLIRTLARDARLHGCVQYLVTTVLSTTRSLWPVFSSRRYSLAAHASAIVRVSLPVTIQNASRDLAMLQRTTSIMSHGETNSSSKAP